MTVVGHRTLEPLISLDRVSTNLYCYNVWVHCYYCFYIIFSANPVRLSNELYGDPNIEAAHFKDLFMNNPDQLKIQRIGSCFVSFYHNLHPDPLRERSFNMTRGNEDIEGGSENF